MLVLSKDQGRDCKSVFEEQADIWIDKWMSSQSAGYMGKLECLILLPVNTHCTWHAKLGSGGGTPFLISKSLNTLPSSPASCQGINTGSWIS